MRPAVFVFLSGCLTFGVPLFFALRELFVLRQSESGGWRPESSPPAPEPPPKPLPDCLLVAFQPVVRVDETPKTRVLETA